MQKYCKYVINLPYSINKGMKRINILPTLKTLVKIFDIGMNYYSISKSHKSGVKGVLIRNECDVILTINT